MLLQVRKRLSFLLILLVLNGIHGHVFGQSSSAFQKGTFVSKADSMQYRLLYPKNYHKHRRYPLIVFLHGDGERGSDNNKQLYFIPKALVDSAGRIKFPCFILAPQCPINRIWAYFPNFPESLSTTDLPTFPARWTFTLIDSLIKVLSIDKSRIYITGYSGGGEGTYDFLTRRPDLFAAAISLCAVADTGKAVLIHKIPIWDFHGSKDNINDVKYSRMIIDALKKSGGYPKYTEYEGMGHNIIEKAYSQPGLFDWLFSQNMSNRKSAL